jgi:hypothetical protein
MTTFSSIALKKFHLSGLIFRLVSPDLNVLVDTLVDELLGSLPSTGERRVPPPHILGLLLRREKLVGLRESSLGLQVASRPRHEATIVARATLKLLD